MKGHRLLLSVIGLILMGLLAIGCSTPEPEVVEVIVTAPPEVVEVTVEVEKEVEVTVEVVRIEEVEKEVVVTQVVEVIADYQPEGTVTHAHNVNHLTWDPHNDQRTISLHYLNPVFEGLLREATDGKSFIPELATGWEEDETGITFTLREGVTFSDGTPFNADAVIANINRVKESGHNVNKGLLSAIESVEAIDDLTVRLNYSQFDGTILLSLARFAGKMISPAAFDTVLENPIGTGPYIYNLEESAADNTFKVYDYNPNYWNTNAQPIARFELNHVVDGAIRLNGLLAEEFHTSVIAANAQIAQLESQGYVVTQQPSVAWSAHILDRTGQIVPELADENVRLAMMYALDREVFFQVVNPGAPTEQHALPGGYAYSEEIADLSFNLEKAQELMAEAGNPTFTIDLPSFGPFGPRNAFLASSWEPLGISVNIVEVNNIFAACQQNEGDFPIAICPINERHIKHYTENRLLETGFLNPFNHVDEEIEALYEQAKNLSLAEAEPFYAEIARISAEKGYVLHLGWASSPVGYDPGRISGVELRFIYPGTYYLGDVSLNE